MLAAPLILPARRLGGWEPDKLFRGNQTGFCLIADKEYLWKEQGRVSHPEKHGDRVGYWDDISGHGNDFFNTDSSNYLYFSENYGYPAVSSEGTSDRCVNADISSPAVFDRDADWTVVIANNWDEASGRSLVCKENLYTADTSNPAIILAINKANSFASGATRVSVTMSGKGVYSVAYNDNGASSHWYAYNNMSQDDDVNYDLVNYNIHYFRIGCGYSAAGLHSTTATVTGDCGYLGGVMVIQKNLRDDDPHDFEMIRKYMAWRLNVSI